ncbi:MAG: exo-rhamnogalacturonan lyase family protein [Planctomycetota bacterium]|jgi:hypothetical protein
MAKCKVLFSLTFLLLIAFNFTVFAQNRIAVTEEPIAEWEELAAKEKIEVAVKTADGDIVIDGVLNEKSWEGALAVDNFPHLNNAPAEAVKWVTAKILHNKDNIYFGVELVKPAGKLKATMDKNQTRIWNDDCLEVFISNFGYGRTMYQIDINGNGVYWAGSKIRGREWKPVLEAKAKILDKTWVVEFVLPKKYLPVVKKTGLMSLNFRYLIGGGNGYSVWSAETDVSGGFPVINFTGKPIAKGLVFTHFRIPDYIPAGEDKYIGVKVKNPSAEEKQAVVRISEVTGAAKMLGQITEKIPANSERELLFKAVFKQGEKKTLLLQAAQRGLPFDIIGRKQVETLEPIKMSFYRERIWYGDDSFDGLIEVGTQPSENDKIRIDLWSELSRLSFREVSLNKNSRYRISLGLGGLAPGNYTMLTAMESGGKKYNLKNKLTIKQSMALPEKKQVELKTSWPEGLNISGILPLYAGISFPGGMIKDLKMIRVVDADNDEVTVQKKILATWSPRGSIKWLSLRFNGSKDKKYFAEFGSSVRAEASEGNPVAVSKSAEGVVVKTAGIEFNMPAVGSLFGKIIKDGKIISENKKGCLLVADQNKIYADETYDKKSILAVETEGPLYTVVKREGLLYTAKGRRLGKYLVRVCFYAGTPFIKVQHSFINSEDTYKLQYSDISLRLAENLSGAKTVYLDHKPAFDAESTAKEINPARGESAYILQSVYKHHFQPESKFKAAFKSSPSAKEEILTSGTEAGQWLCLKGESNAIAVTIPHLAQMFPKELEVSKDGITAHLWSGRGGRNLDYRPEKLLDYYDRNWIDAARGGYKGGAKAFEALYANGQSSARTHDIYISFLSTCPYYSGSGLAEFE